MLSKKTMDIISIVFILVLVVLVYFSFTLKSNAAEEIVMNAFNSNSSLDSITNALSNDSRYQLSGYLTIFSEIFALFYWIFVLTLELQFYKKGLVSIADVIVIAILIPLAIFFYFVSIRGKYKKLDVSS